MVKLLERIYQGDTLEVDLDKENKTFSVKTGISIQNRTIVKVDTFTEITGPGRIQIYVTNILKSIGIQDGSFNLNSIQSRNVRKIVLSPLGYPTYVSRVIKNKE